MLRDDTVYLKFSTYHGLLHDASFLELLDMLHGWRGGLFSHYQDLLIRGRPRPVTPELLLEVLDARVGAGLHQQARMKLWSAPGSVVRSCELHAGAHPYSGVFHTQLELRLERGWFVRNPARAPEVTRRRFVEIARLILPYQGHAHDTDDNAIQNTDNLGLLERGFGLRPQGPIDLAQNPGRELSRREFRYAVNWLTLLGPALLARLGEDKIEGAVATRVERLDIDPEARQSLSRELAARLGAPEDHSQDAWWLLQVGASPLDADKAEQRQMQGALRRQLGMVELAAQERWGLGYWQRKA